MESNKITGPIGPISVPNPTCPVVLNYREDEWRILREALFREGARLLINDKDEYRGLLVMDMLDHMAVSRSIQSRCWPEEVRSN